MLPKFRNPGNTLFSFSQIAEIKTRTPTAIFVNDRDTMTATPNFLPGFLVGSIPAAMGPIHERKISAINAEAVTQARVTQNRLAQRLRPKVPRMGKNNMEIERKKQCEIKKIR